MKSVLVLCTGNSCRCVMAEALVNHLYGTQYKAFSSGSRPSATIHHKTIETLNHDGIETEKLYSKSWDEFEGQSFHLVISVCDAAAKEVCPVFLGSHEKLQWRIPDPAAATGSDEAINTAFDQVLSLLKTKLKRALL